MTTVQDTERYLEHLCDKLNIDGDRRILVASHVTWMPNNGDAWFFLQRVPIYEQANDCKLVILVDRGLRQLVESRARLLEYGGYEFEFVEIPDDLPIPERYQRSYDPIPAGKALPRADRSHILQNPKMDYLAHRKSTRRFRTVYSNISFAPTLELAKFSQFFSVLHCNPNDDGVRHPRKEGVSASLMKHLSIIPGRTVVLAPESNSIAGPGPEFWNTLAHQLRSAGYSVIFNSEDPRYLGIRCVISWPDLLGVLDVCGYVIGVRSGFFDFAIESDASFIILSPSRWQRFVRAHFPDETRKVLFLEVQRTNPSEFVKDILYPISSSISILYPLEHVFRFYKQAGRSSSERLFRSVKSSISALGQKRR